MRKELLRETKAHLSHSLTVGLLHLQGAISAQLDQYYLLVSVCTSASVFMPASSSSRSVRILLTSKG